MLTYNYGNYYRPTLFLNRDDLVLFCNQKMDYKIYKNYVPIPSRFFIKSDEHGYRLISDIIVKNIKNKYGLLRDFIINYTGEDNLYLAPFTKRAKLQLYYMDKKNAIYFAITEFERNSVEKTKSYIRFLSLVYTKFSYKDKIDIAPLEFRLYIFEKWLDSINENSSEIIQNFADFLNKFSEYMYQMSKMQFVNMSKSDSIILNRILERIKLILGSRYITVFEETLEKLDIPITNGLIQAYSVYNFDEIDHYDEIVGMQNYFLQSPNFICYLTQKDCTIDNINIHKFVRAASCKLPLTNILWIGVHNGCPYILVSNNPFRRAAGYGGGV